MTSVYCLILYGIGISYLLYCSLSDILLHRRIKLLGIFIIFSYWIIPYLQDLYLIYLHILTSPINFPYLIYRAFLGCGYLVVSWNVTPRSLSVTSFYCSNIIGMNWYFPLKFSWGVLKTISYFCQVIQGWIFRDKIVSIWC